MTKDIPRTNNNESYFKGELQNIIYFVRYSFEVFHQMLRFYRQRQVSKIVLYRQILFTGYEALSLIALIAFSIGGIIILEGNAILPGFGQSKIFYTILVSVVTRELGCILTAFIIIARSGTAISTELGNMVINQEIDALQSFGISPISYLIVPRVLGVIISMITLTLFFNAFAIFGAWLLSFFFYSLNFSEFFHSLFSELAVRDIFSSVLKSVAFGFTIALISSYEGMKVSFASTEVPQRTIKAVVRSLTWIIIFDIIITMWFYFI
jgi:phospholipid/cholesterol/gamma-HCH transport system permease protein